MCTGRQHIEVENHWERDRLNMCQANVRMCQYFRDALYFLSLASNVKPKMISLKPSVQRRRPTHKQLRVTVAWRSGRWRRGRCRS